MRPTHLWPGLLLAAGLSTLGAAPASAQLNGENLLGDMGVRSGSQAAPGLYVSGLYYLYHTSTLRDGHGHRIAIDPGNPARQTIHALCPVVLYVSRFTLLGGNVGMMAVLPFASGALEAPVLGLTEKASFGVSDLYVVPVQVGWHLPRADLLASFGVFVPTGRYTAGASDNLGKGMWSYELAGGATVFLDPGRTISLATTAFWEVHSAKEGEFPIGNAALRDVKVGQLLTLEGGLAKSFLSDAAHLGVAYYAQWKLTDDHFGAPVQLPVEIARHRVFAVGPDVTLPIAIRSRLIALVNARYLWETGARAKSEGQTLTVTATFPVPSIKVPAKGT